MFQKNLFNRFSLSLFVFLSLSVYPEAKLPELTPKNTTTKINEFLKEHASYHKLTPELVKRTFQNFIEELDPTNTYFIEPDIHEWLEPSDALLDKALNDFNNGNYQTFHEIHAAMVKAINRRHEFEKKINAADLP